MILPLLSSVNVTLSVTFPESDISVEEKGLITFSLWLDRCCCVWVKDSDDFRNDVARWMEGSGNYFLLAPKES